MKTIRAELSVEEILKMIGEIPPFPKVVSRFIERVRDPKASLEELAEIISGDPALSAFVLRMANSPLHRRGFAAATTLTIPHAVNILGVRILESVVLSYALKSLLRRSTLTEALLWEHSLASAVASAELVTLIHSKKVQTAYVCGLLHDVGKTVLYQRFPRRMTRIIEDQYNGLWEGNQQISLEMERKRLGIDHCRVGAVALDVWQCGEEAVISCAYHHRPAQALRRSIMPAIVRMGDLIAQKLEYGPLRRPDLDLSRIRQALKLPERAFAETLDRIERKVREILTVFSEG